MSDFPKGGKKYNHTKAIMKDRRFVYYYMSTKIDDSFMIGNVANFGRNNTVALVGTSLSDLYFYGRKTNVIEEKSIAKVKPVRNNIKTKYKRLFKKILDKDLKTE